MKTNNGIELNLKESEYYFEFYGAVFYFSSKFYLEKFKTEINSFIGLEHVKLYNKYKVRIDLKLYLAISLYKRIEKRGFRVVYENLEIPEFSKFLVNEIIN